MRDPQVQETLKSLLAYYEDHDAVAEAASIVAAQAAAEGDFESFVFAVNTQFAALREKKARWKASHRK